MAVPIEGAKAALLDSLGVTLAWDPSEDSRMLFAVEEDDVTPDELVRRCSPPGSRAGPTTSRPPAGSAAAPSRNPRSGGGGR